MAPTARKPALPSWKCDDFHCPECELVFYEKGYDKYLLHLDDYDQELETPVCESFPCAYCDVRFSRRDALIQHYESGPCQSLLKRLNPTSYINIYRLWITTHLFKHRFEPPPPPPPPPPIATKRSWNTRTQRYKCYLCITDHIGYLSLPCLNKHLAGSTHAAGRYQCPYSHCRRQFHTLPGLVQHIETRTCHCMGRYNWLDYYVLNDDARLLPSAITLSRDNNAPMVGDALQMYSTRIQAVRLVRDWVYRRDSRWKVAIAWGRRMCVPATKMLHLNWFWGHELVFAMGGAMVLGLLCMVYTTDWVWE